jgi:hypothetical protein
MTVPENPSSRTGDHKHDHDGPKYYHEHPQPKAEASTFQGVRIEPNALLLIVVLTSYLTLLPLAFEAAVQGIGIVSGTTKVLSFPITSLILLLSNLDSKSLHFTSLCRFKNL